MVKFFLSIYDWLGKRKLLAIILLVVFMILCVVLSLRIHYQEDIAAFLPKNELNNKYSYLYQHIGNQNKVIVIFSSNKKEKNSDDIIQAMNAFGENWKQIDTNNLVKDMNVQVDESLVLDMMGFIQENYPYFLTDDDYKRMDSLLETPNYVATQLNNDKQMLMLPTAGMMTTNISSDPLHLFTPVLTRLQSFQVGNQYSVVDGYLFNSAENQGIIYFTSPFGVSESNKNKTLADMINKTIKKTTKTNTYVNISSIGAPLIAVSNSSQIKKDSFLAVSLSVIFILILLLVAFRRVSDLLWIGFSIIFGMLFALGAMALYNDSISIIVLGIGSVIIGIAVNYPLHFLDHLKHENNKRQALKEMITPLIIGNITTVSAFLSLIWLDSSAMRDLGVFGSLVLIGTILFVVVFLPLFAKARKHTSNEDKLTFGRLASFSFEKKRWLLYPMIIITILLGYFSFKTSFDDDISHINYMTSQQKKDMNMLANSLQTKNKVSVFAVSHGNDIQTALESNEKLQKQLEKLKKDQDCEISGVGNFLPSKNKQQQCINKWNVFWQKHREQILKDIQEESKRQGFADNAFAQFTTMIKSQYVVQNIDFFSPIIQSVGKNYIIKDNKNIYVSNFVQVPKQDKDKVKQDLRNNQKNNSYIFDSSDIGNQLVSILSDNFNYIGYTCSFIVFFFLWLSFGRIELSLISFLPLAVSWLWILGIMQLTSIQFNIVNIILATFIFGQGDDYTIFITDGLMYEYAYKKKMLASYKNSVALSALLMFVGIGTLIFAKHPAMRSLAEVTIIGMFTVVFMAFYLPPLVFRWITTKKGKIRQVPITFKRLVYSLFAFIVFLFGAVFVTLFAILYFNFTKKTEKKKLLYHKVLCWASGFVIKRVPATKFKFNNKTNEDFIKPAVIICNHQSHLDLMCLMMLTPKLVILTNNWVWKNPFYGLIIRYAEFNPISDGIENNLLNLQSLINRGYSVVVFPEGTRSEDCSILRFHRGAFYLAEQLNIDILPIFIHGVGHVLPKNDFMLRQGNIYIEVEKRISYNNIKEVNDFKDMTKFIHNYYVKHYNEISKQEEKTEYFIDYVKHKYMYKGREIENNCKKILKQKEILKQYIDKEYNEAINVWIINSGQGEFAWLFALVNKNTNVYAFADNEQDYLLASNCSDIPKNLHFCYLKQDLDINIFSDSCDMCYVISSKELLNKYIKYNPILIEL